MDNDYFLCCDYRIFAENFWAKSQDTRKPRIISRSDSLTHSPTPLLEPPALQAAPGLKIDQAASFNPITKKCNLSNLEKYYLIFEPDNISTLNKNDELNL